MSRESVFASTRRNFMWHIIFGWASTVCLGLGGIPQGYKSWKEGHSEGLSWGLLLLWQTGELTMLGYSIPLKGFQGSWPVFLIALVNAIVAGVILRFKLFPRKIQVEIPRPESLPLKLALPRDLKV